MTRYQQGVRVELLTRDHLTGLGFFATRLPASKTAVDVIACRPGLVLFVQCKRSGALRPPEWNALMDAAEAAGAVAIMAEKPARKPLTLWRLLERKDGSGRRQPMERYEVLTPVETLCL